ncbi:MAG: FGGY family carbohydrate kinase, partial [Dehalococcoidia bacterium]
MPPDLTLVIDAGTSALRAVTVSADGGVAVVAREPWNTVTPEDAAPFGRELDATSAQAALLRAIAAARGESHIAGIAFTGQREGLVFVDDAGDALLVSPNVDARAAAAGMAIDAKHAAEVYRATGHLPSLMQAAAKLAWMREHRPRDAARVRYAMPLADWLASTLTGERRASRCLLVENGLLDITAAAPFDALGSPSGAGSSIAPPSVADGSIVGACRSGDTAQLPVVLCGGDTLCARVGTGAVEAVAGAVAAGWSAPVQIVTPSVVFDAAMRTWAGLHVVPDRWIVESNAGETGRVWEWLLSMLGVPASDADAAAAASPAGAHDV